MNYYDKQRETLNNLIAQSFRIKFGKQLLTDEYLKGVVNAMLDYMRLLNVVEANFEDKTQDCVEKTFEIYKGFNTEPLTPNDRFYFLKDYESNRIHDIGNGVKVQYHGIKLAKSYPLYNLPDNDEFLKDLCDE